MAPLLVVLGYLIGSIPFGLLLGRVAGIDVRRLGSGNIGAANVARSAGAWLGLATLVADAAKGAMAVAAARAFLGHCYPITLRFAGGKGVATAFGVMVTLALRVALAAGATFALAFVLTRRVSVGSGLGALAAPVAALLLGETRAVTVACAAMATVIVVRHLDNLGRLRRGTEPRFTLPKRQAPPGN